MSKNLFIFAFFLAIVIGVLAIGLNSPKGQFTVKDVLKMFGLYRGEKPVKDFINKNALNRQKAKDQQEATEDRQKSLMETRKDAQAQAAENLKSQRERMEDMKARQDAQRELMMDRIRDQRR